MVQLAAVFTFLGITLTSLSIGALLFLSGTLDAGFSAFSSLASFCILIVWQMSHTFRASQSLVKIEVQDLVQNVVTLSRELDTLRDRQDRLKTAHQKSFEGFGRTISEEMTTLQARMSEIEAQFAPLTPRVIHLEDDYAQLDKSLDALKSHTRELAEHFYHQKQSGKTGVQAIPQRAAAAPHAALSHDVNSSRGDLPPVPRRLQRFSADDVLTIVRDAITHERHTLYMQPIVQLPSRRIRGYAGYARLALANGTLLTSEEFLPFVDACHLRPQLDLLSVKRGLDALNTLHKRNNALFLTVAISYETLSDALAFPELFHLVSHGDARRRLVLEMAQDDLFELDDVAFENIRQLKEVGVRFSVDHVNDLDLDFDGYAEIGVIFTKINPELFFDPQAQQNLDLSIQDLSLYAQRFGIDFVAANVERESTVAQLSDYHISFGQGLLFGAGKPLQIRPEADNTTHSNDTKPTSEHSTSKKTGRKALVNKQRVA